MVIPAAQTGVEKLREPHNKLTPDKGKRTYHSIWTLSPLSSWVTLLPELLVQAFKPFQPDTTSMLPGTEMRALAPEKQPYPAETACLVWGMKVSSHMTLSNNTRRFFYPCKNFSASSNAQFRYIYPLHQQGHCFHSEERNGITVATGGFVGISCCLLLDWTLGMEMLQSQGNAITGLKTT